MSETCRQLQARIVELDGLVAQAVVDAEVARVHAEECVNACTAAAQRSQLVLDLALARSAHLDSMAAQQQRRRSQVIDEDTARTDAAVQRIVIRRASDMAAVLAETHGLCGTVCMHFDGTQRCISARPMSCRRAWRICDTARRICGSRHSSTARALPTLAHRDRCWKSVRARP